MPISAKIKPTAKLSKVRQATFTLSFGAFWGEGMELGGREKNGKKKLVIGKARERKHAKKVEIIELNL